MKEEGYLFHSSNDRPLADLLRPIAWEDFFGIDAVDNNLMAQIKSGKGKPPSLVLWGPPGSGKTTFARLFGKSFNHEFVELSAVLSGVKEVREIVSKAKGTPTILFIDEIHRFNKAQQDAFLPHVEKGVVSLLGATTENPSFYLTSALLSRMRVIVLPELKKSALEKILNRAELELEFQFEEGARNVLFELSMGDARRLLNIVEAYKETRWKPSAKGQEISEKELRKFLSASKIIFYDRSGEEHFNNVSAFIKSLRGSDPDAALFWGFRMIEGGEDPRYIIRRMIVFASEDIGNADPRALQLAVSTFEAFERIGLPEGKIPIAHCITYLASAPKSNRSYLAMHKAIDAITRHPKASVPLHLRNAPTGLMKSLGYGEEYRYPHDEGGFASGVVYLPDELKGEKFYEPTNRGLEKTIKERFELLKSSRKNHAS